MTRSGLAALVAAAGLLLAAPGAGAAPAPVPLTSGSVSFAVPVPVNFCGGSFCYVGLGASWSVAPR